MLNSFHQPYRHQAVHGEVIPPFKWVQLVGEWQNTPIRLRLIGKPRFRRQLTMYRGHVPHSCEWEYGHSRVTIDAVA